MGYMNLGKFSDRIGIHRPSGEMVYTLVLGTNAARRGGSSPLLGTSKKCLALCEIFFL